MIVLVLFVYTGIGLLEIRPLVKKKETGKLVAYTLIFVCALTLSVLLSVGVDIPSPTIFIKKSFFLL